MRRLSDTIARLNAATQMPGMMPIAPTQLRPLTDFGSNPGALLGWTHVPDGRDLPLVVVLHGCTQNAAGYDRGSGWSALADRFGFALLFPEQTRANNPNLCFNWFQPEDVRRAGGEVTSIRQMIAAMVATHDIDPARVFVTGLSAGGAMTSAMLAAYPEVFAGGAIIAGLPYGAAASVSQALDRMRGHGHGDDAAYARAIRAASAHRGPWPVVSVWHGDADRTVDAVNADRILGQWRALQGLPAAPDGDEALDGHRHRVWRSAAGAAQLEDYRIVGLGHGTPLATTGPTATGTPMPHMLDAGISSTWHIAERWGLLSAERVTAVPPPPHSTTPPVDSVQATIAAAFRSAGLMR